MNYKNLCLAVIAFFGALPVSGFSAGKISDKDRPSFGVIGGATFGGASVKNADGVEDITTSDTGFVVGVTMETPAFLGPLYFQPELNFSRTASSQTSFSGVKLDYLEAPLLIRAKAWRVISIAIGPAPAYLVGASSDNGALNRNGLRHFDLRGVADVSIEIPINEEALFRIGARYVRGFLDIDPSSASRSSEAFYTTAGILF